MWQTHKQRNGQTQNYCFTLCHMNVVSILTTEICEPLCIILLKCFRRQKPTLIQRQTPTYFLYLIAWIIYVLPSCSCPQLLDHIFQQIYLARTVLSETDIQETHEQIKIHFQQILTNCLSITTKNLRNFSIKCNYKQTFSQYTVNVKIPINCFHMTDMSSSFYVSRILKRLLHYMH